MISDVRLFPDAFRLTMPKALFCLAWSSIVLVEVEGAGSTLEALLPQGDARPPIVSGHFPDRVHEFVWRNWNAVEPPKLAKILGATEQEITALAESMGLPHASPVLPELRERGYITLIRRNWHLLPYLFTELVGGQRNTGGIGGTKALLNAWL